MVVVNEATAGEALENTRASDENDGSRGTDLDDSQSVDVCREQECRTYILIG